jgi:glutamine synthetase
VKKDEAIFQIIRQYIMESKKVRFEGNSYSDEWHKEAKKRGLTNVTDVVEAIDAYLSPKSKRLFKAMKVMNDRELDGRAEVRFDNYTKRIQIESRVIGDIALGQIVPIAIEYQSRLLENVKAIKEVFSQTEFKELAGARLELIKTISEHITTIKAKVFDMTEARKVANVITEAREKAIKYDATVLPFIEDIRYHIDKLEEIVDNEMWPLPKYREMLFCR